MTEEQRRQYEAWARRLPELSPEALAPDGIGIPAEERDRVLRALARLKETRRLNQETDWDRFQDECMRAVGNRASDKPPPRGAAFTCIYALLEPEHPRIPRYVGKSNQPSARLCDHLRRYGRNPRKHSWVSRLQEQGLRPVLFILEVCRIAEWEERERWWIRNLREVGYDLLNLTDGGDCGPVTGISPETRAKMVASRLARGWKHTPESIEKMRESRAGKRPTPEAVARRAAGLRGKPKSPEHVAKVAAANRGRPLSPERKETLRQAMLNFKHTEETRARISATLKGRVFSEEHRRKISEGLRDRVPSEAQLEALRKYRDQRRLS
jgi:hypothetical protein